MHHINIFVVKFQLV